MRTAVDDPLWRGLVAVHVDDDRDRRVEAGPEALGQQVVRLARRLLLRLRPLVGGAEADESRRAGSHQGHQEHHREHDLRVSRDEPAPAGDGSLLPTRFRIVERAQERDLQPVDLVPELREHCDQQRVRDQHGSENAERRADAELRHEVEAEDGEAAHGDRDRQACEQHRPACRRARLGGGVCRRHAVVQQLSEACDDEQRVVDADTEPDHRDEQRRDRVDVGQSGEEEKQEERGGHRRDGERERNRRRHEGAEDDHQDDQGREQAEQFLRSLLDGRELGVAVELHLHTSRLDRRADSILDGDDRLAILLVDHPVELSLRVRDAAVVGDGVLGERCLDALEACLVLRRLELRPAERRDRLVDRLLALGRVEPLSRWNGKHDVQHAALLFGELCLDQVRRLLRVRAGDLELVAKRTGERDGEDDEHGENAQPRADDAPGVRRAAPHPPRQPPGRKSFVRCPPFCAVRHLTSSRRVRL